MTDIEDLETKDRIAIIDPDKCKPLKCGKQCIKMCPVVRQGPICIEIDKEAKEGKGLARIAESLCIGCGVCVKACPFNAIKIVNISKGLAKDIVHRYGANSFKLHKLPDIKRGMITGILGQNGLGKSTILSIFARETTMNLGNYGTNSSESDKTIKNNKKLLDRFRGTSVQAIIEGKVKHILKPQNMSRYQTDMKVSEYLGLGLGFGCSTTDQSLSDLGCKATDQSLSDLGFTSEHSETINQSHDNLGNAAGQTLRDLIDDFNLTDLLNQPMKTLSGGELQRVLIADCCFQGLINPEIQLFLFDEPTSFLDLKQRVSMANMIYKFCCRSSTYTVVVDHDMSILDYLSEQIVILYGERAVYGVCALPLAVGQGINQYMDGYLSKENVRFRKEPYKFQRSPDELMLSLDAGNADIKDGDNDTNSSSITSKVTTTNIKPSKKSVYVNPVFSYSEIQWSIGNFNLTVQAADYMSYGITVLLGENGFGKTTFVNLLSTMVKTEESGYKQIVAHKDQYIDRVALQHANETVEQFIGPVIHSPGVMIEIIMKLNIDGLLYQKLCKLSGGELQKVLIVKCLLESADIYLFDEPSAFLDAETRVQVARIIRKRFEDRPNAMAFVIEHDILMSTYLADRVIIFSKVENTDESKSPESNSVELNSEESKIEVKRHVIASKPLSVQEGMNAYMKSLNITLRKDQTNFRHRINKLGSAKDTEQKKEGKHYY